MNNISALVVMPWECCWPLLGHLAGSGMRVIHARNCEDARHIFATEPGIEVVVTEAALPDGDWRQVLEHVAQSRTGAQVIVCTRCDDVGLWCEVIQRGAYDLIVPPYHKAEVQRIIEGAACRSRTKGRPVRPQAAGARIN